MTCVSDIALSIVVLIAQPVIFFTIDGHMVLICNGFFANRSATFDHACLSLFCICLHSNVVCIVFQFVLRFSKFIVYLVFVAIWCSIQAAIAVWTFMLGNGDDVREQGLLYLREMGWKYDEARAPFPSFSASLKTFIHHGFYIVSCGSGYVVILWCEVKIFRHLSRHGSSIHEKTKQMHAQVNRALISLAIAPLAVMISPILFIFGVAFARVPISPTVYASLTLVFSLITCVNPLTTMYFVRPYRNSLMSVVKIRPAMASSVDPVTAERQLEKSKTNTNVYTMS
ncbi:Protein SRD-4 [Aphelenchoides avenae]|nr:Protein SRD-4 [Aphelenchus avenae]